MCSDACKQVFGATFGKEWIQCLYLCDQLSRFQNVTKLLKKARIYPLESRDSFVPSSRTFQHVLNNNIKNVLSAGSKRQYARLRTNFKMLF